MDVPVKVHVRIKPYELHSDSKESQKQILVKLSSTKVEFNQEKEFTFDYVYETTCSQSEVFETSALPLLHQFVLGYNVTIMAYGPTGSGKSYTLGTSNTEKHINRSSNDKGLLTNIVAWIFSKKIEKSNQGTISRVQVSFLEIYKEEIFDLLSPVLARIEVKNDKVENVVMENITELNVDHQQDALDIIHNANLKRQVKKTKSNDSSSRSHAIITLKLEFEKNGETRHSRFRLVDLAGSEAVAKDGVIGEIKNEGIFINKGLLALGKVINALNSKNVSHIPHRESILTRALKDSLSGNSLTNLICCVKADVQSINTTSAALQFAAKARAVKTKVQLTPFKTPFKPSIAQVPLKTPVKPPFKIPANTPFRTPLVPIQRNKVVTPSLALPIQLSTFDEPLDDLDESIFVSGSYGKIQPKVTDLDIENRIQTAVMERVDMFLEGFRDKLAQSLLNNCSHHSTSCQSLLDSDIENQPRIRKRNSQSEPNSLNLTVATTVNSSQIDGRRRSTRLADKNLKRLTLSNVTTNGNDGKLLDRLTVSKSTKRAPTLSLPTPEGKLEQHVIKYKKDMLHYLNHASQSQMQKLPSVGPKAGHSIITYRNLNGKFDDLITLKLVPGLRKNFYDNFIKVNFLE